MDSLLPVRHDVHALSAIRHCTSFTRFRRKDTDIFSPVQFLH